VFRFQGQIEASQRDDFMPFYRFAELEPVPAYHDPGTHGPLVIGSAFPRRGRRRLVLLLGAAARRVARPSPGVLASHRRHEVGTSTCHGT
jgi:hypothetical protein